MHQLENGFDVGQTDVRSDSRGSTATPFDRVQFGLFALASGTGVGGILADGKADSSGAFVPLQVVSALGMSLLAAIKDEIGLDSAG